MRIGYDAKRAFLNSSGLGYYSRNTLNAMNKFCSENEYVLFTTEKNKKFFNPDGQEVVYPKSILGKLAKSVWRTFGVSRLMKKREVQLFHGLSNELPKGIHKQRVKTVVTIHDLIFLRYPELFSIIDRKIYLAKVKYACTVADKIIAISKQTKDDLISFFNIPQKKIKIVYQSVSPIFFDEVSESNVFYKYDIPKKYIVVVGTIEKRKGQLNILMALKNLANDMSVVFVGKKTYPYMTKIDRFISENNLKEQVFFLHDVPVADLAAIYKNALLSIYISVCEGFGLPVIEAMACGCPVLTSNVSVLPETAGNAALLCNPENIYDIVNKINLIVNDSSLKKMLREKGRERAELFQEKNYAERLNVLYSQLLNYENV